MMNRLHALIPLAALALFGLPGGTVVSAEGNEHATRQIRRSDVVFMYDDPTMYEPYGCTVLGWAGSSKSKQHIEQAHAAGVRHFAVSVGWLTESQGMIDFSADFLDAAARNYSGEPFVTPWLTDHQHKGQPSWWWCTNSPLYRRFLESRLEQRMTLNPDGLHIDDYRGSSGAVTWLSACFCRHCLAEFRQYLADEVSKEKLVELGIENLNDFDYRQFLIDKNVDPKDYNHRRSQLPLADEFYDFHVGANTQYVRAYRRRAEQIRGKPLSLCVNSGLSNPQALSIAPELTYFCCEVPHRAETLAVATHPIAIYKLGDGLDRPITSTASGQDWARVAEEGRPSLVRSWAALSYALGHNFMAPHRQWCYTSEKGTHWYNGPQEQYAWLYRFIGDQARLLNGYEAVAPVAVVYDNAANRKNQGKIEATCVALAERSIPFTVVVAGDNWLDYRINAAQLDKFAAVVTACDTRWMDPTQKQVLDEVDQQGRLLKTIDDARLAKLIGKPIEITGDKQVMAVARTKVGDDQSPAVLHLLNRQYDGKSDAMVPQLDFAVRLSDSLFAGRTFRKAMMHSPKAEPIELSLTRKGNTTELHVDRIDLWGIVELIP
ncbi:Alpha-agarase precursor [Planctomycetes bacterium CA13]|uniref:Alpha-agarase n=1 Tax=Novipirellula herctigrandis TaxID=2527986 RepID=A0A5C5YVB7_9BACT|nr:Alpha-agarase precursor [Planctomycetes bacterium CA13]